jgi:hypothetical protein
LVAHVLFEQPAAIVAANHGIGQIKILDDRLGLADGATGIEQTLSDGVQGGSLARSIRKKWTCRYASSIVLNPQNSDSETIGSTFLGILVLCFRMSLCRDSCEFSAQLRLHNRAAMLHRFLYFPGTNCEILQVHFESPRQGFWPRPPAP